MMTGFSDWVSNFLKFTDLKTENENVDPKNLSDDSNKISQLWPRLLSFTPNPQDCDNVTTNQSGPFTGDSNMHNHPMSHNPKDQIPIDECDDDDATIQFEEECEDDASEMPHRSGGWSRKLRCMIRGARYGLREGALTGIFFGGGYGLYKYASGRKGGEGGSSSEDNPDSTVNDGIIFVTAANGAIAMAVFCMFFCSTKAAMYCT